LRRLEGRARLKLAGAVLAIAALVAGSGWMVAKKLAARAREVARAVPPARAVAPPAPAVVPPPAVKAPAAPVPEPAPVTPTKRTASVARPRPARTTPIAAVPPASTEPVPTRTFTLGPTPQNVDVYLDGQRLFGYDVDHTKISVPWSGVHYIEFRSPSNCCFPERVVVGPEQPLPADSIIARRLKWRPAHLMISTEPASATTRVMVSDPARSGATTAARP